MPGVVLDFFHQPSFPNGAVIETISNNAWLVSSFLGPLPLALSYTLTIKPCLRCSGGPQKQETDDTAHGPFLPCNKACKDDKEAQWGFIVLEVTRRTSQKTSSNSCVNFCYFYSLFFSQKSWEDTPGSFTWPRKNDSWKTTFLLGWPIFRGYVC